MLAPIGVAALGALVGWAYLALKPPPPKNCGSPGGPPVTSPRIKLNDGRHLAYKEVGISKEVAKNKIVIVHGFDSSKDINLPFSQELIEELQIYFLLFDKPGYGESDPCPTRSVKSETFDIEQLADKLQIGPKFHVIGISLGAYSIWGCLKYIPHRLSGAALVVPMVNYWWPCFPSNLAKEAFKKLPVRDQWVFRIAYHTPRLFFFWMRQKLFPTLSMLTGNMSILGPVDIEVLKKLSETPGVGQEKIRQQGLEESLYRDVLVGYSKWEFDPLDVEDPFPNTDGSVHIWQGLEDRFIPRELNRYLSERLPWIQYHEAANVGHCMLFDDGWLETVLRQLLQRRGSVSPAH